MIKDVKILVFNTSFIIEELRFTSKNMFQYNKTTHVIQCAMHLQF